MFYKRKIQGFKKNYDTKPSKYTQQTTVTHNTWHPPFSHVLIYTRKRIYSNQSHASGSVFVLPCMYEHFIINPFTHTRDIVETKLNDFVKYLLIESIYCVLIIHTHTHINWMANSIFDFQSKEQRHIFSYVIIYAWYMCVCVSMVHARNRATHDKMTWMKK